MNDGAALTRGLGALALLLAVAGSVRAEPANLALGKPVTPLTDTVQGQPEDTVDGNPATVWWSYQGVPTDVSFIVDLQRAEHFTSVVQHPRQNAEFMVEISLDGQQWTLLHAQSLPWPGNAEVSLQRPERPRARFFRYTGSNAENAYAGIGDFQVFDADRVFADGFEAGASP